MLQNNKCIYSISNLEFVRMERPHWKLTWGKFWSLDLVVSQLAGLLIDSKLENKKKTIKQWDACMVS